MKSSFAIALILAAGLCSAQSAEPPLRAEEQVATGRFLTALEVRPILTATKPNWVALRDWQGQDLLYVTQILSWRCGLVALRVGINGGAPQVWPLPECRVDTAQPAAILDGDTVYQAYPAGTIQEITVELTYDDLTTDTARFERAAVMMP